MRLAVLSPLPPSRTGVAHYASMLLPALAKEADVRAFASLDGYRRDDFDRVIYQLGNNPHHEWIYAEAMREPGVIVLHDLVLHHLIVEMTLARGDVDAYVSALDANHGPAGAAWARGRAAGLHSEMGNFLLPASVQVAQCAESVIVHNRYAADRLRSFGVQTPIHVVPHPYVPDGCRPGRPPLPGVPPGSQIIGFFGFLTSAKRAEVVLDAFRIARSKNPKLVLLVVGEPAPNIDIESLRSDGVVFTGYVSDEDFPSYYSVADRFVNLRYPTAGETSGTLIRALDAGKPVAVSDYAQFAELPDDIVFKVPLGEGEVDRLVEFFSREFDDPAPRQRAWLEANAKLELTVAGYLEALECGGRAAAFESGGSAAALQIFPALALVHVDAGNIVVKNVGRDTIRTRTYGQPEYRLIVRLFDGDMQVHDQWLSLPRDLHPGDVAEIPFPRIAAKATTLRLYHALQDVPMLDPEPWETARV